MSNYVIEQYSRPNVNDLKMKGLFWGPPMSGKTIAASTWPKPMLFIDIDHNMLSIKLTDGISRVEVPYESPTRLKPRHEKSGQIITVNQPMGYTVLVDVMNELHNQAESGEFLWKTVVLDGLTSLCDTISLFHSWLNKSVGITLGVSDYNPVVQMIQDYLVALLELPCNVIVTAHDNYKGEIEVGVAQGKLQDQLSKPQLRVPYVPGRKLPFIIGKFFDEVWLFDTEDVVEVVDKRAVRYVRYFAHVQSYKGSPAGSRLGFEGTEICPVTYERYCEELTKC